MNTNVAEFFADLDGGVFEEKLAHALSEVALAVVEQDKAGRIKLTFDLKRIGTSYQVNVAHKLEYVRPTGRGKLSEDNTTASPMHVGTGGRLSLFPENQAQMFDKTGQTIANKEST
jgi:hypothetical protein